MDCRFWQDGKEKCGPLQGQFDWNGRDAHLREEHHYLSRGLGLAQGLSNLLSRFIFLRQAEEEFRNNGNNKEI